jgi:hypothetical protein
MLVWTGESDNLTVRVAGLHTFIAPLELCRIAASRAVLYSRQFEASSNADSHLL